LTCLQTPKRSINSKTRLKPRFLLQWHLTERCNLRCKHCYQNLDYLGKEISEREKKDIIKRFIKFCKKLNRVPRLAFTGGEPLLVIDELDRLIEYGKEICPELQVVIMTNGTLVDEYLSFFERWQPLYVQVSLDGADAETHEGIRGRGTFARTLGAIRALTELGIPVAVMSVFHKDNERTLLDLVDLCHSLKVSRLGVTALVPEGAGAKMSDKLLSPEEVHQLFLKLVQKQSELEKKGSSLIIDMRRPLWVLVKDEAEKLNVSAEVGGSCAAGFSCLALLPNGDVMPCRRMNVVIGNLVKQNFFEIWYGSNLLNDLREKSAVECSSCEFLRSCGGCKAVSKAVNGSFFVRDPLCWKQ